MPKLYLDMILRRFFCIHFIILILTAIVKADYSDDWRVVEALAEEYPYVVALLNKSKEYLCSGTTISRRSVLTSGSCIATKPVYVAAAVAVLNKHISANLFDVSYTKVHDDYTYVMNASDPKMTQMHSNIGLLFVTRPALDLFLPPATLGSYFASELVDVELTSVGFGRRYQQNGDNYFLQHQCYDQTPCANPRWYYCVCGTYVTTEPFHGREFGDGAPVLFGSNVVCVSTGGSAFNFSHAKHNIFTVIGAYIPWMEKVETIKPVTNQRRQFRGVAKKKAEQTHDHMTYCGFIILLVICLKLI